MVAYRVPELLTDTVVLALVLLRAYKLDAKPRADRSEVADGSVSIANGRTGGGAAGAGDAQTPHRSVCRSVYG